MNTPMMNGFMAYLLEVMLVLIPLLMLAAGIVVVVQQISRWRTTPEDEHYSDHRELGEITVPLANVPPEDMEGFTYPRTWVYDATNDETDFPEPLSETEIAVNALEAAITAWRSGFISDEGLVKQLVSTVDIVEGNKGPCPLCGQF